MAVVEGVILMKNITPAKFKCSLSMACPSVHKSDDGKTYRIKGNYISLEGHITKKEVEIDISAELLEEAIRGQINDK